jgi:peroxiredoxin
MILLATIMLGCQKRTTNDIIKNFEKEVKKNSAWEYDINYKMKYFSSEADTLNYNSNCRLIRHASDTIFGGSFWIKNDSIDRYYDLQHIYVINHTKKKITRYFPHQGQDWIITGNTISDVLNSYFFNTNKLSKSLQDSTTVKQLTDTIYKNTNRKAVTFKFKDNPPIEKQQKTLFFDKSDHLKSIVFSVKFQKSWQYNEWHFSNEKYDAITDKDLRSEFENLRKSYTIEDYKKPDPQAMKPLKNGLKAPEFKGVSFQENLSIHFKDYKNKYVLIDFWYKNCFPCIEAIESLTKIRKKYSSDDLVILGLNPFDSKEKDKAKLEEFIETNKMNYPTVFVDKDVVDAYNVKVYPTFYIIDDKGKIVYSKVGHNDKNEMEIDSLLNKWLK